MRTLLRRALWLLVAGCVMVGAVGGCRQDRPPQRQQRASRPAARRLPDDEPKAIRIQPGDGPTSSGTATPPWRVVHVFVALCDNTNQGIVPVPAKLGDGQDPAGNLYWGAMYGVKTFLKRSPHWTVVEETRPRLSPGALDRVVFRSREVRPPVYVLAEAYNGAKMQTALTDFFLAAAGRSSRDFTVAEQNGARRLQAGGAADMVCFVGHNGLMDVSLPEIPSAGLGRTSPASVVLACRSNSYFAAPLGRLGSRPLITTSGLMAPEAYTLDAIIRSWAAGDTAESIHAKAAAAYAKYQRCSVGAAKRLFVAGQ